MSEHAVSTSPAPSKETSKSVGAPFFPSADAIRQGAYGNGNGVRPHPLVDEDQSDPEVSAETKLKDTKDVVTLAFGWMSQDAEARLSKLEADLRAQDAPTFSEQLLRAAFRTALSAATSGASEHIAGLIVGSRADALRELVKTAIESSVGESIELGANALRGSNEPLTAFIAAQKAAVRHLYRKAQGNWLHKGRHGVHTQAQADILEGALTQPQMELAADSHYVAGRDAWLTYLAQSRFGVRHSKALDENYDIVEFGPTTDLTPSSSRELRPGDHLTTDSPDKASALMGVADGVMTVQA
jgi:hypothetical protein